ERPPITIPDYFRRNCASWLFCSGAQSNHRRSSDRYSEIVMRALGAGSPARTFFLDRRPFLRQTGVPRPLVVVIGVTRVVTDLPHAAVGPQVKPVLLFQVQGTGADPAEDGDLVAAFVHGAVAIEALGDRQGH